MNLKIDLTEKQEEALMYLHDQTTTELLFGGGGGGGKTVLGCIWIVQNCLEYSGTRWVIARKVLKRLKETTLITFWAVCKMFNLKAGGHFEYKEQAGVINFKNGSSVLLKDLAWNPSDPEFDELGSLEITGAFADEVAQIMNKAKNILLSRCGRCLNDKYKIPPKLLMTCNPNKGWAYSEFYKPNKDGLLLPHRKFIQALAVDNPFISDQYIKNLKRLDKITIERLLYGNWEFDDDPARLFEYEEVLDLFTNPVVPDETKKYISCDVARFGDDRTVICLWHGLACKRIYTFRKLSVVDVVKKIEEISATEQIQRSHIVVDEDGVGGGVVDTLRGCKGFVNNSRPILPRGSKEVPNYANLKTQCYYEFARLTRSGKISIEGINPEDRDLLIEELQNVKQKDIDKDGKISLVGKDVVKENIQRSPDLADALMMRMCFEFQSVSIIKPYFV